MNTDLWVYVKRGLLLVPLIVALVLLELACPTMFIRGWQ